VDEVGANDPVAVAEEHVVAVPLIHAEIDSTPKSTSKLSVMVYQGTSQPIFAFRRAMSACDAREAHAGVVPRALRWAVHTAEVFTTGVSGAAHWRLGNVDVTLARRLAFAGVAGGGTGAYLSTALPGSVIRQFVSLYLLAMGIMIVWRAIGVGWAITAVPPHRSRRRHT
jgi:Sulfite exporter TauE/SafE